MTEKHLIQYRIHRIIERFEDSSGFKHINWAFVSRIQTYLVGGAITMLKNDGVRQWEGFHSPLIIPVSHDVC